MSVQCLIIRANTRGIIITMEKIAPFFMKMEKPQKPVSSFSCSAIDLINDCSRMLDTALYSKPPKREERALFKWPMEIFIPLKIQFISIMPKSFDAKPYAMTVCHDCSHLCLHWPQKNEKLIKVTLSLHTFLMEKPIVT